ncbi:TetR/AcrR family transcriptional regulator [Sphaerisporangium corydalis]|uniref:TetR/AcrR family transcriptional regulator n=1 Tax=Sphaerisporangium corydalis TaxID=1441875 RepID=A0ABV9EH32_9ACTN|nr:TetR family transcriptional regulator [Sphaerisporangium corydalis]
MTTPHDTALDAAATRPAQERGRRRRAALVRAAVGLLEEGGFTAVTHRAVARRAGFPLAATTYYFASRDQLVAESFALLVAGELDGMRARLQAVPDEGLTAPQELARTLTEAMGPGGEGDRLRQLGLWELYLQAGRDPALQAIARDWTDGCDALVAGTLARAGRPSGRDAARMVGVLLAGLWMEHLVEARPGAAAETHALLTRALRAL